MTEEQLLAFEAWIVTIIRDEEPRSDVYESLARSRALNDVRNKFNLVHYLDMNEGMN